MPDFAEPRLLMLQVIREYAADRLHEIGEAETVKDRHAAAYQELAELAAPNLLGSDQKLWLDRLELDHDNFRAAFDWSVARGDAQRALSLGAAFWRFWQLRGHLREGRARLDAILAMPGVAEHREDRLRALEAAGGVVYWQGDMPAAKALYDECLEEARATGDKGAMAHALYNASFPRMVDQSDLHAGIDLLEEALPLFREVKDDLGLARCQWAIASARHFERRFDEAIVALDEAIPLFRKLDERFSLGWALHTRAVIAIPMGECGPAQEFVREGLDIFSRANDLSGITLFLDDAASVAQLCGDHLRALRLAGAAAVHQALTGAGLGTIVGTEEGRNWLKNISTDDERRAWAQGQAMTVEQAVAYALVQESAEATGRAS